MVSLRALPRLLDPPSPPSGLASRGVFAPGEAPGAMDEASEACISGLEEGPIREFRRRLVQEAQSRQLAFPARVSSV